METLLAMLAEMSADYLIRQLQAGADCVQIFDSWAGVLDEASFEAYAVKPVARMVQKVRAAVPGAKIIGFAKGAGALREVVVFRRRRGRVRHQTRRLVQRLDGPNLVSRRVQPS